ncbi:MAG: circadian clock protein KaiB [Gemmatimonadaceae bacterium]|nr:circadian clock protein KaiB [Gemmatimonadaceae bacterium]
MAPRSLDSILRLRLYIAGRSPNSVLAESNLRAVCAAHFAAGHELEIVDLLQNSELAARDRVIVTPTLVKMSPAPTQRLIGNLSDHQLVFSTLAAE